MTLTGSNFADGFAVRSTPGVFAPMTVNGGLGNDLLVVGSLGHTPDGILGRVTFNAAGTEFVLPNPGAII